MRVRLLNLRSSALKRLKHLQQTRSKSLCINVTGGGCSGFQYHFRLLNSNVLQNNSPGHTSSFNFNNKFSDHEFTGEKEQDENDEDELVLIYDEAGVKIFSDPESSKLIEGCTLDFQQELIGSKFVLDEIQNSVRKCSCGNSFDLKDL